MELVAFIIAGVLMGAAFLFLEYKFAKTNKDEEEGLPGEIHRTLVKLGAKNIEFDGHQGFRFGIDDEVLWLNVSCSPMIEVMLQNSTDGCEDIELAKQIGANMTSQMGGGRIVFKDGYIFTGGCSLLHGEDGLNEGLPVILYYVFTAREKYITKYEEALKAKQSETNTTKE